MTRKKVIRLLIELGDSFAEIYETRQQVTIKPYRASVCRENLQKIIDFLKATKT